MTKRFLRWVCKWLDHDPRNRLEEDGSVRWWCARCDTPPKFSEDRQAIRDYGAPPDLPPRSP